MKDNFSQQAAAYARFRPGYPDELFEFLYRHCRQFNTAWDCATGNGQIAVKLAEKFKRVEATDISEKQLAQAIPSANVRYTIQEAEEPQFGIEGGYPVFDWELESDQSLSHAYSYLNGTFDLIVVGQAAHWFDLGRFYERAKMLIKPGGVLALVGYNVLKIDDRVDPVVDHLYRGILDKYWDPERHFVENGYKTMPFPFDEIPFPPMEMSYQWTREHLLGYLSTWSALKHFEKEHGHSPIDAAFLELLEAVWPEGEIKTVRFPIFGRVTVVQ